MYSPYFEHLKEAWEKRNDKNFLFLFYEDTVKVKLKILVYFSKRIGPRTDPCGVQYDDLIEKKIYLLTK